MRVKMLEENGIIFGRGVIVKITKSGGKKE
jgi:DNA-binding Lrp family transcriptional regulator